MFDYIKKVSQQVFDFIAELSPGKKIALFLTFVTVVGGMTMMIMWAGDTSFKTLMSNLNPQDAANINRILREKKIPFEMDASGRNIRVQQEYVDELRLELATMGLPESSVVGYEIFDTQSLGQTSFVQKVNQKRAQEGELMRTISTIKGIRRARVHLAVPKKSAFVEDQEKPSASVVIDLEPGIRLSQKQIYGIGRLVSAAVEGLQVDDVSIVDAHGKLLSKANRDSFIALSASQLDYQRNLESDYEKRIESMLERVIGSGKVVATVTAELDFARVTQTQTNYDPDGAAVTSSQVDKQSLQGSRPSPFGVAGVTTNTPGQQPAGGGNVTSATNKDRQVSNMVVPKTVTQTQNPIGSLKKLSIAILVDGKDVTSTGENGETLTKVEPWPPEKLTEFERVISGAVGLNPQRGDTVQIRNMEFVKSSFAEAEKMVEVSKQRAYFMRFITIAVIGLVMVLFFLFVVRPFIKWMTENTIDSVDTFLPQTIEELEKLQKNQALPGLEEALPELPDEIDPRKVEGEMIKEKIITLVDSNPMKAALILRDWIRSDRKKDDQAAG